MQAAQSQISYELPSEIRRLREERVRKLQEEIESMNQRELESQIQELRRKLRDQQESRTEQSQESQKTIVEQQSGATVAVVGRVDEVRSEDIGLSTRFGELTVSFAQDVIVAGPAGTGLDSIRQGTVIIVEGEQEGADRIKASRIHIVD